MWIVGMSENLNDGWLLRMGMCISYDLYMCKFF
jgi:hypothetical protein